MIKNFLSLRLLLQFTMFSILLLAFSHQYANSKELLSVDFDFGSMNFKSPLPFDIRFIIKGNAPDGVQKIELYYKCKKGKSKPYFPDKVKFDWLGTNDKMVIFVIGPLHANAVYKFKFTLFFRPGTSLDAGALKNQVFTILKDNLEKFFKDSVLDNNEVDKINNQIKALLSRSLNTNITNIKTGGIDIIKEPYATIITNINQAYTDRNDAKETIDNRIKNINVHFGIMPDAKKPNQNIIGLAETLRKIIENPKTLSSPAQKWWTSPLNPTRSAFKLLTMEATARIVLDLITRPINFQSILNGNAKIMGTAIEPADEYDPSSLAIIADFFQLISLESFKNQDNNRVISSSIAKFLQNKIIPSLYTIIKKIDEHKQTDLELTRIKNDFPDVLSDLILQTSYEIETIPIEVPEKQHPYIGLDLGVGYAPDLKKFFSYTGANIYLVPVNKKASLNIFKGWDWVRKRFSLLFGLTVTGIEEGDVKKMFSAGSIVAGAGFRIFPSLRVNAGWLFFKQEDENPLIDKENMKATMFLSASFDIDVQKFIGRIGNLFGD